MPLAQNLASTLMLPLKSSGIGWNYGLNAAGAAEGTSSSAILAFQ